MSKIISPPAVVGVDQRKDKHHMYFTLIVDIFPSLKGPTALSEANKMLSGNEIHPLPAPHPTIRSFS